MSIKYNIIEINLWSEMYKKGMTIEKISLNTNTPKSTIRKY